MTGILCGLFENKLVGSRFPPRQLSKKKKKKKVEIRGEDYGLNNPSMAFSLSYVSSCNLSPKYIFLIQRAGGMPSEFQLKSFCLGLCTLFSTLS